MKSEKSFVPYVLILYPDSLIPPCSYLGWSLVSVLIHAHVSIRMSLLPL